MRSIRSLKPGAVALFLSVLASACTVTEVRTTDFTPAQAAAAAPDEYLLDVAIARFDPGIDDLDEDDLVYPATRRSESVWIAVQLKDTLDRTGGWGVVRVVPDDEVRADVMVDGTILQSDGETMRVHVVARDAAGSVWLDREYEQMISHYAYSDANLNREDPFQGMYNEISNDLLVALEQLSPARRKEIVRIGDIRFAAAFAPEAFGDFLARDENGNYRVDRLPAENDPMLARVREIEVRDQLFQDVLQDYYATFTLNMEDPYTVWRQQSYIETISIQELEESARNRKLAGIFGIVGGIGAQFVDDSTVNMAGVVGISAGALAIQSGFRKSDEAMLHNTMLSEMSESLESELEPSIIALEDRTVTLTGTVRDQYQQWREILRELYFRETGRSAEQIPEPEIIESP